MNVLNDYQHSNHMAAMVDDYYSEYIAVIIQVACKICQVLSLGYYWAYNSVYDKYEYNIVPSV